MLGRWLFFWVGNIWFVLACLSAALKLVIVPEQPGLIRPAWDLNLLLCLCQCHYTPTSYIHSLMRLYEIFKPLPGGAQSGCVCLLHISECASLLFDLSVSGDKHSGVRNRQTQEYIYMHLYTDTIRVGIIIYYSRAYHPRWWRMWERWGSLGQMEKCVLAGFVLAWF